MTAQEKAIQYINAIQEQLDEMQALLDQEKADVDKADYATVSEFAYINEQLAQTLAFWNNEQE